jgi:regulator of PEP synthase PpsR (kinase-PPPase family)
MNTPAIFVVSGGSGASADQLVQTALAQFPDNQMKVRIFSNIRETEQVNDILSQAKMEDAVIVHTMVDFKVFDYLTTRADHMGIFHIDEMQSLLQKLSLMLNKEPEGHPGLYRKLHKKYYDRIAAIEFTMAHDDGKDPAGWKEAEIVITGVSRVGKTPLSMYISVLGWKVANVPLVYGIDPNPLLFEVDRRRLVGLTIHPGQLVIHRQHRQRRLGALVSKYADPSKVLEELEFFNELLRKKSVILIDVTDKPIETSADEILRHVQHE